ncbi:hypothetical protein HDE_06565 [Halotydeus destructor]|nr:hypothetical protein HDE_06565 [Halotydeus destructor]
MSPNKIVPMETSYRDDVTSFYQSLLEQGKRFDKWFQYVGVAIPTPGKKPRKLVIFVQWLVILLVSSTMVRYICLFFMTDLPIPGRILYLGDVGLLSLQSTFAMVTIGYQVHCLLILLVFAVVDHQDWPKKLYNVHCMIADLPLIYSESSHILEITRFRKRMLIQIAASLLLVVGSLTVMVVDVAIKHDGDYSLAAYFIWSVVFFLDVFVTTCVTLFSLVRFATLSKLITSALKVINLNLELLADKSKRGLLSRNDVDLFKQLFQAHESVIEAIARCNRFWKSYLLVFYISLVPCTCFLLYSLIFGDAGFWPRLSFFDLALCMIAFISYISIVAAQVHDEAHACYDSVFKMVLHQSCDKVRGEGSLWLQRLSGSPISFYFWDFVPMTKSVLTSIFSITLTYLFLISDSRAKANRGVTN